MAPQMRRPRSFCLVAVVSVGLVLFAGYAEARLWECQVKGIYDFASGKIAPPKYDSLFRAKVDDTIYFDETTGLLRARREDFDSKLELQVWQAGVDGNSTIAIKLDKGAASNPVTVLEIQQWRDGIPFLFYEIQHLMSGNCTVLSDG